MKTTTLLNTLIATLALSGFASAGIEQTESYSFDVSSGDLLEVRVQDADVTVSGNPSATTAEIVITQKSRTDDEEKAQKAFSRVVYFCSQDGDRVLLESKRDKSSNWKLFQGKDYWVKTRVEITIPEEFRVQLKTSDGNLVLQQTKGDVELRTSDGDLRATRIVGNLMVKSSDGDIILEEIAGDVNAITSDGDVEMYEVVGDINAQSSDGNLDLKGVDGSLQCRTSDGNVSVSFVNTPASDCHVNASDGNIRVALPADARMNFDLSSHDGRIDFPFHVEQMNSSHGDSHRVKSFQYPEASLLKASSHDGNISIHSKS